MLGFPETHTRALTCSCNDGRHTLLFTLWDEFDDVNDTYIEMEIFLCNERKFRHRLWEGIKYILGIGKRNGNFCGRIFHPHGIDELNELIQMYYRLKTDRTNREKFINVLDNDASQQEVKDEAKG